MSTDAPNYNFFRGHRICTNTGKNSAVPVTPTEIVKSAVDAAIAGAAIVHCHVRDPETAQPSMDIEFYREITEGIRNSGVDVILNLTTGPGARFSPSKNDPSKASSDTKICTPSERVTHVIELRPEICSLDIVTMNRKHHVFLNHPEHIKSMSVAIQAAGVKPELEVFDTGHILNAISLIKDGFIQSPPFFQFCLGVDFGAPATVESILMMKNMLPRDAAWSAFGISRFQFPMVAAGFTWWSCKGLVLGPIYLGGLAPQMQSLIEGGRNYS